jgi:hypothetical protein
VSINEEAKHFVGFFPNRANIDKNHQRKKQITHAEYIWEVMP